VGTAFSYQIVARNSPTSYGASGLPAGLTVNSSTDLISGTPTTAGTYSIQISASNAGGTQSTTLILTMSAKTSGMVYVNAEAESAAISSPMTIVADARAQRGKYVTSTAANSGTATCTVTLSASATYVIWGRVLAPNSNQDSFFVSMDGGTEDIYDAEDTWSTAFQWTK
jgi:Putative Ig domain